jgi:hypothetical protein
MTSGAQVLRWLVHGVRSVLGAEVDNAREHSWSWCREALALLGCLSSWS